MFDRSMKFGLGEEIDALREMVRRFAQEKIAPIAADIDRQNEFPAGLWGELGALEYAFDEMAFSLETRTNELRRAEALYREIVEMNPAAFYVAPADLDAVAEYVSPRMQELTGWTPAEWMSRPGLRREAVDPADRERVRGEIVPAELHGPSAIRTWAEIEELDRSLPATDVIERLRNGAQGVWVVPTMGSADHPRSGTRYVTPKWGDTRIGIEPVARGATPQFVRFGIKVAAFDSAAVAPLLRAAGAEILTVAPSLIRFRDNYGITLEVVAG